jgi:hypothetical protein
MYLALQLGKKDRPRIGGPSVRPNIILSKLSLRIQSSSIIKRHTWLALHDLLYLTLGHHI